MKISDLKKFKKILILGYGIEGQATSRFLNKFVPNSEIIIADEKIDGANFLKKQDHSNLVIKTPGINKEVITKPYTTATNIFFANIDINKTIGVTGTKGKSTTTALLNQVLRQNRLKTALLGNIGKPMLDVITAGKSIDWYIIELSSYQLDDIKTKMTFFSLILNLASLFSLLNRYPQKRDLLPNRHRL